MVLYDSGEMRLKRENIEVRGMQKGEGKERNLEIHMWCLNECGLELVCFVSLGAWDLDVRLESKETKKAKVAKKLRKS
jgi:hypothetical protein